MLEATSLPLIVYGPGQRDKDNEVLVAAAEEAAGERIALGNCEDKNYRTIVAAAMANDHVIVAKSPIDVNLAKQLNVLIGDMGLARDRILMDPTTGALGYGLEYSYSVMERVRLAALTGDATLQQPLVSRWATRLGAPRKRAPTRTCRPSGATGSSGRSCGSPTQPSRFWKPAPTSWCCATPTPSLLVSAHDDHRATAHRLRVKRRRHMALSGIAIYKMLPQTNCKECGHPTCLAFAMKLAARQAELAACPYVSDEAKAQLDNASAPPIRLISLGSGERKFEVGNETVVFRHEKTFVPPARALSAPARDALAGRRLRGQAGSRSPATRSSGWARPSGPTASP